MLRLSFFTVFILIGAKDPAPEQAWRQVPEALCVCCVECDGEERSFAARIYGTDESV